LVLPGCLSPNFTLAARSPELSARRPVGARWICMKFQTGPTSAAMCFAEAASHLVLEVLGFDLAPAAVVHIGAELAADIAAQYGIDPPIVAGRHFGTEFLEDAVGVDPKQLDPEMIDDPLAIYRVYLADILLGNDDRTTGGNLLLRVPREPGKKLVVVPIDHSEAFGAFGCLRRAGCLDGKKDSLMAKIMPCCEPIALRAGPARMTGEVGRVAALSARIRATVNEVPAEWVERGGVDHEGVQNFLEHRAANMAHVSGLPGWLARAELLREQKDLLLGGESVA
jgi:hypothetical protein